MNLGTIEPINRERITQPFEGENISSIPIRWAFHHNWMEQISNSPNYQLNWSVCAGIFIRTGEKKKHNETDKTDTKEIETDYGVILARLSIFIQGLK